MLALLAMSVLLGASAFACGILPLSFTFAKTHLTCMSSLSTGLLVGTALGVIIPEGIETLLETDEPTDIPTTRISLSLLIGFTLMLLLEQLISPHSHSASHNNHLPLHNVGGVFDAELNALEREQGSGYSDTEGPTNEYPNQESSEHALPLTLGLVIHALADGLALGTTFQGDEASKLSVIVFLAIIVHKAPTALALTSTLLSMSISRSEIKKHLAAFCVSTPIAALASTSLLGFFNVQNDNNWTGTALLLSGGSFLYVATVLQPGSATTDSGEGYVKSSIKTAITATGMFVPLILGSLLGHGH